MHELSVATEICRIAEAHSGGYPARVTAVGIEMGQDCGLEPANLVFCLDVLLAQPPFSRARAELKTIPGDDLRVDYVEVDE
jgi:Zn finger protein HypA/HybF involved in hydrogenase expression